MLLFHGTNIPKETNLNDPNINNSNNSSNNSNNSNLENNKNSSTQIQREGLSPFQSQHQQSNANHNLNHHHNNNHNQYYNQNKTHNRHLEERLGPGGGAQGIHSGNVRRQNPQTNEKQRLNLLFASLKDPSSYFPGYQQFFFRFLLIMDSSKLNNHLSDILFEEILHLTNVLSEGDYKEYISQLRSGRWTTDSLYHDMFNLNSTSENLNKGMTNESTIKDFFIQSSEKIEVPSKHLSFNIRILQLRILGKFFGLLHHYPFWTLSLHGMNININTENPLVDMISKAALFRNNVVNGNINISRLLYLSWKDSTLTLTISWIVNYFKMMAWDNTSIFHTNYDPLISGSEHSLQTVKTDHIHTIAILFSIMKSPEYNLSTYSLSRNR